MELIDALGIAGPFRTTSPWELEDVDGRHLIHAGGYAAVPFGESYPPLMATVQRFLPRAATWGCRSSRCRPGARPSRRTWSRCCAAVAPSHERSRVFFSNSGAEAIEAAIKFVRAHRPNGVLINFSRAYHGKTAGRWR
jgi:4-aminobutyrate aminotransferase-like enzyme